MAGLHSGAIVLIEQFVVADEAVSIAIRCLVVAIGGWLCRCPMADIVRGDQRLQRPRADACRSRIRRRRTRDRAAELVRPGESPRQRTSLVVGRRRRGGCTFRSQGLQARRRGHGDPTEPPVGKQRRKNVISGAAGARPKTKRALLAGHRRRDDRSPSICRATTRIKSLAIGGRPYDVAIARNGSRLYVSDWAGRAVLAVDPTTCGSSAKIAVGEHPNQIAVHPKDDRLFVACASSNCVSVIDTRRGDRDRDDPHGPVPQGPRREHARRPGRRPRRQDALRRQRRQQLRGGHRHRSARTGARSRASSPPAGIRRPWPSRPTARRCWSASARGTRPGRTRSIAKDRTRPRRQTARRSRPLFPYIGTTLSGALSIVPMPDDKKLAAYTETVYRNCPYSDKLLTDAPHPREDGDPDQGRRPVADQARHLHHQGEPDLRPGLRRHRRGATATRRW